MSDAPAVAMDEASHRFETTLEGATAFADYRLADGVLTLPHTVVPEALGGRGIASALAKAALGYARAQGLKVRPNCPFMAGYIARHPEEQDLLDPNFRPSPGV